MYRKNSASLLAKSLFREGMLKPWFLSTGRRIAGTGGEIARKIGMFQFEQGGFSVESAAVSDECASQADDPVARDDQGNGIVSDCAADRLRRHARDAFLPCDGFCDCSVGHGAAIRDCEHDLTDFLPESRGSEHDRRRKSGIASVDRKSTRLNSSHSWSSRMPSSA